jgi:hypothetical protein
MGETDLSQCDTFVVAPVENATVDLSEMHLVFRSPAVQTTLLHRARRLMPIQDLAILKKPRRRPK